jgi:hypothetical protein
MFFDSAIACATTGAPHQKLPTPFNTRFRSSAIRISGEQMAAKIALITVRR